MSTEAITRIRAQFETELTANPDDFHPIDIARVRTEDWQIRRFLLSHPDDESKAAKALFTALRWKKSFGIHDRQDDYFPKEWWEMTAAETCGRDRDGHLIQWGMLRRLVNFKQPGARKLTHQFIGHVCERLDVMAGEVGYTVIADAAGAGLSNMDIDNIRFALSVIEHYPNGMRAAYAVNLPWILNGLIKFVFTFMPAKLKELVHFVSVEELAEVVDPKDIPVALKGKREKSVFPPGLRPAEECALELDLDDKVLHTLKKMEVQM